MSERGKSSHTRVTIWRIKKKHKPDLKGWELLSNNTSNNQLGSATCATQNKRIIIINRVISAIEINLDQTVYIIDPVQQKGTNGAKTRQMGLPGLGQAHTLATSIKKGSIAFIPNQLIKPTKSN